MKKIILFVTCSLFLIVSVFSQTTNREEFQLNTITTAVPFLLIGPDSRAGGMGDVGVATSADVNSMHWNPAKYAFTKKDMEFSMSYSPWLRQLVNDIKLAYLSAYKRIDKMSTAAFALRYFSLGKITFTDITGATIRDFTPNEFSLDGAYARKLSDRFSASMAGRYIYSNLTGGLTVLGADTKPGQSLAVDVSMFYNNEDIMLGEMKAHYAAGLNISNIGAKMAYSNAARRDFLPCNLRLGNALTMTPDEHNKVTIALDFNKLLVPTPPQYYNNGDIFSGQNPDKGVASAIFSSFYDAPGQVIRNNQGEPIEVVKGSKFKEELREINIGAGTEWIYDNQFAARFGYFHEHPTKGNRKYFTFGIGLKYKVFGLDISYLASVTRNNPLARTLRFTLSFAFEKPKTEKPSDI